MIAYEQLLLINPHIGTHLHPSIAFKIHIQIHLRIRFCTYILANPLYCSSIIAVVLGFPKIRLSPTAQTAAGAPQAVGYTSRGTHQWIFTK